MTDYRHPRYPRWMIVAMGFAIALALVWYLYGWFVKLLSTGQL